jgi:hypothetical protein
MMAKRIVHGPGVSGAVVVADDHDHDSDDDDHSGRNVHPGDTVRISAPGQPGDGAVGVVLDVVAVLPKNAAAPYIVARTNVEKV